MAGKATSVLVLVLSAATVFAGCINPNDPDVQAAAEEDVDELLAQFQAQLSPAGTKDDWFLLSAKAGPDAPLTAAWWTIPQGAIVESETWEDEAFIVLEVAHLLPDGRDAPLDAWTLRGFAKDEGELMPWFGASAVPVDGELAFNLAEQPFDEPIHRGPYLLHVWADDLEAGDRLAFVFGALAADEMDVGLAFRVLSKDPGFDDDASEDAEAFLRETGGRRPVALVASGTGAGFLEAVYLEWNGLGFFPYHARLQTSTVDVTGGVSPDMRPVAAVRDQTFSTAYEGDAGWSTATAMYYAENAYGEWSMASDLHGTPLEGGGALVQTTFGVGGILTGFPVAFGMAEGAGGALSTLRIESTVAGQYEMLLFTQSSLGATLDSLLGTPSASGAYATRGLLEGPAWVGQAGDLHLGGMTLVGALPADAPAGPLLPAQA